MAAITQTDAVELPTSGPVTATKLEVHFWMCAPFHDCVREWRNIDWRFPRFDNHATERLDEEEMHAA
jgi:hypothetical protein